METNTEPVTPISAMSYTENDRCRDAILGSNHYDKTSPSFSYVRYIINVKPSVQVRNCGILLL